MSYAHECMYVCTCTFSRIEIQLKTIQNNNAGRTPVMCSDDSNIRLITDGIRERGGEGAPIKSSFGLHTYVYIHVSTGVFLLLGQMHPPNNKTCNVLQSMCTWLKKRIIHTYVMNECMRFFYREWIHELPIPSVSHLKGIFKENLRTSCFQYFIMWK